MNSQPILQVIIGGEPHSSGGYNLVDERMRRHETTVGLQQGCGQKYMKAEATCSYSIAYDPPSRS
jgi:hypothetical protein